MGSVNTDQWIACSYLDGSTTDFIVFLRCSRASSWGSIRKSNAQARRPFAAYAFEMAHLPAKRSMHSYPPWKLKACSITSISMHSRTGRKPGRLSPLGIARGNVHIGLHRFFSESLNFISWCYLNTPECRLSSDMDCKMEMPLNLHIRNRSSRFSTFCFFITFFMCQAFPQANSGARWGEDHAEYHIYPWSWTMIGIYIAEDRVLWGVHTEERLQTVCPFETAEV